MSQKAEQFLDSIPARKIKMPERNRYNEGALDSAIRSLRHYLVEGEEDSLMKLRELMDKQPLAFYNHEEGESALFWTIRSMLVDREINQSTAATVAGRLKKVLEAASAAYNGGEFVRLMVNTRCHPGNIKEAGAWTVRDLLEKSGMMSSYMTYREFKDILDEYKFETTRENVRGIA